MGRTNPMLPVFAMYPQRAHQPQDRLWVGILTGIPAQAVLQRDFFGTFTLTAPANPPGSMDDAAC